MTEYGDRIAELREHTLKLDLQRLPIIDELGKDPDDSDLLDPLGWAAVYYARAGIPVFPLSPGTKIPLARSNGVDDASTDVRRVRAWWRDHRHHNIGLACGVRFDVLDVDCKDGRPGYESLTRLRLAGLTQGAWASSRTPTGGQHVLFTPSADGNHADQRSGLDFRGVGGYIVAPPSRTKDGAYRWEFSDPDARGRPFDWHGAMECLHVPPPKPEHRADVPSGDLGGLVGFVESAEVGGRNNALHWAACKAHQEGLPTAELLAAATGRGLPEAEAARTIASASRTVARSA